MLHTKCEWWEAFATSFWYPYFSRQNYDELLCVAAGVVKIPRNHKDGGTDVLIAAKHLSVFASPGEFFLFGVL